MTNRLPDFIVAGVPRAGTTTLNAHFQAMPGVFVPEGKELHYFTLNAHRGIDWYADHYRGATAEQVCGDLTPTYVLHGSAMREIARVMPEVRVVVVLRDPVDRAYSHFWLNQWKGTERLTFEAALDAEPARLRRDPTNMPHAYVGSGMYARLLGDLFEVVPRDRVLVVMFDDLVADPSRTVADVCAHIGAPSPGPTLLDRHTNHHGPVRSVWASSLARHLPGPACRAIRRWNSSASPYPTMAPATRERLRDHFAADRDELEGLLGRAVPWGRAARR